MGLVWAPLGPAKVWAKEQRLGPGNGAGNAVRPQDGTGYGLPTKMR